MEKKRLSKWALFSLVLAVTGACLLLVSGYGYQWNWWGLGTAFTWVIPASAIIALIALSLALVYSFARSAEPNETGSTVAILGLVLSMGVLGTVGYWFYQAQQYPPIHDITTDIADPPRFQAVVPLRADAPNDTTYGDEDKAEIQRDAYPDIQTLYLDIPYEEAFERAERALEEMPWEEVVTADKKTGIIEAYDQLPWFGFVDDVVIRVDTSESNRGSKIDVRSVSRIGKGDIGVNAHRIRNYLRAVKKQ
ncbi:DUF1499 domain-containing protein [Fodinibius sediminis]|uniref:Uncharacterized conserved protein, DUF1499 family n=1 Tax=Fodinibius sediminis TaxID=1214077 RepID=A0A521AZY3_9BACT|nr:DUF1499 domain-containing protein [Fodinibius sediminis]SMO40392.1 Uncharacterized conserved protein, DUF1499 family [Fodinibius sediminis]